MFLCYEGSSTCWHSHGVIIPQPPINPYNNQPQERR